MKGLFKEEKLQSEKDIEQLNRLENYVNNNIVDNISKFDSFTKYVQTGTISKFIARYEIYKMQMDTMGSIFEFGVARGFGLMTWAQLSTIFEPVNYTRKIVGFESFEGFPSVTKEDENCYSNVVRPGGRKVEDNLYDELREAIAIYDLNRPLGHIEKVKLIKGDITKTLLQYLDENPYTIISLLYIDVDLYEPTKIILENTIDRIPKGGIIVFDEINNEFYPGETRALIDTLGIYKFKLKRFPYTTTLSYAIKE